MVVFTCNACGQSVKKNQVEKHYQTQCRNCTVLSCMDCGKDFHGDDYKKHVKCISEDQKYGGKDYKAPVNKGEAKQEQWIERIHNVISTTKVSKELQDLLEQLVQFTNIPRKKIKFENFIKNSVRVRNPRLVSEAWDIFSKAVQPADNTSAQTKVEEELNKKPVADKSQTDEPITEKKNKKHKKRKAGDDNDDSINVENSKTHKKKKTENGEKAENNNSLNGTSAEEQDIVMIEVIVNDYIKSNNGKRKFRWQHAIVNTLVGADDQELSMKKLRKKVLALYLASGGESKPMGENELRAKFEKKVNKNKKFKVHKDRVKLIS